MSRTLGKLILTLLLVVGIAAPAATAEGAGASPEPAPAELEASQVSTEPYFFQETGHYLSGRFRQYWETRGGLYVFGYPLTRVYDEVSTDGRVYKTQYFERARFEYHPENAQPYDVLLTLVGNEITAGRRNEVPFQPTPRIDFGESCQGYFEPTQHNLKGAFCRFWQRYGGLQNFGYGLSEEFQEVNSVDGKTYTVQYFERGRWEFHPEFLGTDFEVLLGLMGLERIARVGVPETARARETSPPTLSEIPGGGPSFPLQARHIEYGFNAFLIGNSSGDAFNAQTVGKIREAGFGWVRIQLEWRNLEPSPGQHDFGPLDLQVEAASAQGVRILLSVVKSPSWASPSRPAAEDYHGLPENTDAFYNLMRVIAGRYTGKIQAYEIWNEQNLAGEVGGNVQVAPYFETLKAGFSGVKRNDPFAIVLFGGLTPTGVNDRAVAIDDVGYLREFYAYRGGEGKQYFDVLAAHPGSAANPPDARFPSNPGTGACPPAAVERYGSQQGTCYNSSPDFFFRRIEEQRAVMEQSGEAAKQIWLTEFGWNSCPGLAAPARGYEYCQLISDQQQGEYIVRAFQIGKNEWPWMGVMFLWNLNYAAVPGLQPNDEKYPWSVLRADFSGRPAYEAIKGMPK